MTNSIPPPDFPPIMNNAPITFMTKSLPGSRFFKQNNSRKDRPICSHCGIAGHIVKKCYKLHGYPLSFKFTQGTPVQHSANQMQEFGLNAHQLNSPQLSMTFEQCQHFMDMLKQYPLSSPHSSAHFVHSAIFFFFFLRKYNFIEL